MKKIVDTEKLAELEGIWVVAELKKQQIDMDYKQASESANKARMDLHAYIQSCPEVDPVVAKEIDPQSLMEVK
jgi:hypothetical protein